MVETSDTNAPSPNPILFFDGSCALCHRAVSLLLTWERPGHGGLRFAPLDGTTAQAMRDKGQLPAHQDAVILWTPKAVVEGEAAVGAAFHLIGQVRRAKWFRMMPSAIRRSGYRLLARNRQQWFGRVPESCDMPAEPNRMLP